MIAFIIITVLGAILTVSGIYAEAPLTVASSMLLVVGGIVGFMEAKEGEATALPVVFFGLAGIISVVAIAV